MKSAIKCRKRKGPAKTGENELIYAIGDIHGEFDLLVNLMKTIEMHRSQYSQANFMVRIIVLGDFIDRGIDSNRVLNVLFRASRMHDEFVVLAGNHEAAFIDALTNPKVVQFWLDIGGWETLESFDVDPAYYEKSPEKLSEFANDYIGESKLAWLRSLPVSARSGDYFFCHAGVKPGIPLELQDPKHMMWIRDEFTRSNDDHGAVIVHGHTINRVPVLRRNRIGLDTGAFRSGRLSGCAFKDSEITFFY